MKDFSFLSAILEAQFHWRECAMMQKRRWFSIFALVVALVSLQCGAVAQRAIPDDNLAYPVLISVGNGSSGSGFFLNTNNAVYLVTSKHVLFNQSNHGLLSPH